MGSTQHYLDNLNKVSAASVRWQAKFDGDYDDDGGRLMERHLYGLHDGSGYNPLKLPLGEVVPTRGYGCHSRGLAGQVDGWFVRFRHEDLHADEDALLHGCYFSDIEDAKTFLLQLVLNAWLPFEKAREPVRLATKLREEREARERYEAAEREAKEKREREEAERKAAKAKRRAQLEAIASYVQSHLPEVTLEVKDSAFNGLMLTVGGEIDEVAAACGYVEKKKQVDEVVGVVAVPASGGRWTLRYLDGESFAVRRRGACSRFYGSSVYASKAAMRAMHLVELFKGVV